MNNFQGCFADDVNLNEVVGGSRVCCKTLLSSSETFTTYEITSTNPTVSVIVKTSVVEPGTGNVLYSNRHRFGRTGDQTYDKSLNAQIALKSVPGAPDKELLKNRYYNSDDSNTVLVTNKLINSKDEEEIDNIGWLRVTKNGELSFNREKFQNHYHATVNNCKDNLMETKFSGTHKTAPDYQTLQSKHSTTIKSATRNTEGNIEVKTVASSRMSLTLIQSLQEIVFHTDVVSRVTDFTAVLHLSKNSNRKLDIYLNNTYGLLKGTLTAGNKSEMFRLLIHKGETQHTEQGIAVGCVDNATTLCLQTVLRAKDDQHKKCTDVKCDTIDLDDPEETDFNIDHEKREKEGLLNPRSWLKYANPLEWFNGVDSVTEGVIMAVVIIVILILLAVVGCAVRCCCCVYNCCRCFKCCKCKKRKRHTENMHGREGRHGPTERGDIIENLKHIDI
jgi:hypothetical protein